MAAPKGNKNAVGNHGGHPTIYDPIFIEKVDEYLETRKDKIKGKLIEVHIPTLEGFAQFIGVSKDAIEDWEKKYVEFGGSLRKIRTEQHKRLVDRGLEGTYNPTIAKLLLTNNHGMKDQVENTNKIPDEDKELVKNALHAFISRGNSK